jgi:alkylated DNA nucleotide flippase Atl1
MSSTRAPAVAEVLWELKRLDKVAKYSVIAERAGFSAGVNGRAMVTCLATIQKEWPHLQAWRAIRDDGTVQTGSAQSRELEEWGATITPDKEAGRSTVSIDEARLMVWEDSTSKAPKSETATTAAGESE